MDDLPQVLEVSPSEMTTQPYETEAMREARRKVREVVVGGVVAVVAGGGFGKMEGDGR